MQSSSDLLIGTTIGIVAAFLWAISTNVYKSQEDEATPLAISTLKTWMSLVVMAILVILPFRSVPFFIPYNAIIYLAASVTIGLVIGDIAYLTSQERIGVSYAFPIAATYPIATYVIAIFAVGEPLLLTRFSRNICSRRAPTSNSFLWCLPSCTRCDSHISSAGVIRQ
ncbi:MAG: DMT family transporter [Candidatus Thorarchaeota archaeon]|jgi:drug/metabolite transporter (DMT)-like permease